jgi:hypothetical protein
MEAKGIRSVGILLSLVDGGFFQTGARGREKLVASGLRQLD